MLIRIAVVTKEASLRDRLFSLLGTDRIEATAVTALDEAIDLGFDLLVIDAAAPASAEEVLCSDRGPGRPDVIVVTRHAIPEERASLRASGCLGVVDTSLPDRVLSEALAEMIKRTRGRIRERLLSSSIDEGCKLSDFLSSNPRIRNLLDAARRVAPTDAPVTILGETGVGKERLARALHNESRRSSGPFVPVNCAAIPEQLLESELFGHERGAFTGAHRVHRGFFELADGGTIFLDEIAEMSPHLQAKLLRVLQEDKIWRVGSERALSVAVRVIAATNRDLDVEVAADRFRSDLYFRLAVVTLTLPPLRDHPEDISRLAYGYLRQFAVGLDRKIRGIDREAMSALLKYRWPGNVRELINIIERAVILGCNAEITVDDLPSSLSGAGGETVSGSTREAFCRLLGDGLFRRPLKEVSRELLLKFEHVYLTEQLRVTGGCVGETARRAGIDPRSLYTKMRALSLDRHTFDNTSRSDSRSLTGKKASHRDSRSRSR